MLKTVLAVFLLFTLTACATTTTKPKPKTILTSNSLNSPVSIRSISFHRFSLPRDFNRITSVYSTTN